MSDDDISLLQQIPVFTALSNSTLGRLMSMGDLRRFAIHDILMAKGSETDEAMVILDGTVVVVRDDQTIDLCAPALVGEMAGFTQRARAATVRATSAVSALVLERDLFLDAVRTSPQSAQTLTELVAERICAPDSLRQVGRFSVDGVVGRGGSGCVLRARHPLLQIPVALKMLSHALALSEDGPKEFIQEASILAQLDHPGIVRVLDAFESHDTFFIVMPWLEGTSLRERLDRKEDISSHDLLRWTKEALHALRALHDVHLVHRDIKPSNLYLRPSGQLTVIDFGICCAEGHRGEAKHLVGSPSYCSPEQILGRPIDGRADVYSLGCTLYEILYGTPPFIGENIEDVLSGHLRGTPSFPTLSDPLLNERYLPWLKKCLRRTRTSRPNADEALRHLEMLDSPKSSEDHWA